METPPSLLYYNVVGPDMGRVAPHSTTSFYIINGMFSIPYFAHIRGIKM